MGVPPNHPSYCVLYMGRPMVWGTYIWRNPYVQWTSINMLFTKHGELTSWCMKPCRFSTWIMGLTRHGVHLLHFNCNVDEKTLFTPENLGQQSMAFPMFSQHFQVRFPRQPMWPGPKKIVRSPSHWSSQAPWNSSETDVKTWFSWDILGRFQP